MSQALRKRRSLGTSRQAHSSARPQPITLSQQIRLDHNDEAERLQEELEVRRRRQRRRLDELERANYRDAPSTYALADDGAAARSTAPPAAETAAVASTTSEPASRKRTNAEVKRILSTRKGFNVLLEEAETKPGFHAKPNNYLTAAAAPSRYPARSLCSVCGYWGNISCTRCGERYCGSTCGQTHDETRCDRPLR